MRIHAGDQAAEAELYKVFSRGIRISICRQLGPEELEDNVHDCFVASLEAIRKGQVREPERLMGFVRTIVARKVAGQIEKRVQQRSRYCQIDADFSSHRGKDGNTPEYLSFEKERYTQARNALAKLPAQQREILTRFYLLEQSKEQICREMNLTDNQFRLSKSRTKAKLTKKTKSLRTVGRLGL